MNKNEDNEECKHESIKKIEKAKQNKENLALKKMVIVSLICILFMMAEIIGGLLANSLAIITDAAHLFSDLSGFLISIFAIMIGQKPANKIFTFGYHRAEVLGALTSVITIWILTCFLLKEAIDRIANPTPIDAKIMLITSIFGLFCNLVMMEVLHSDLGGGDHGCSHGPSHDHEQNHSNENNLTEKEKLINKDNEVINHLVDKKCEGHNGNHNHSHCGHNKENDNHDHNNGHNHSHSSPIQENNCHDKNHGHNHNENCDDKNHIGENCGENNILMINKENDNANCYNHDSNKIPSKFNGKDDKIQLSFHDHNHSVHNHHEENVNVSAAVIHIIGDIIQSVGVVIAALIIYFYPDMIIVDPICTFFFSIIVFFTTINITKTCLNILMESCPEKYQVEKIELALSKKLPEIISIHEFHIWTLSTGKYRASLHIVSFNKNLVGEVTKIMKTKFMIESVTIQIESPEDNENLLNCLPR